MFTKKMMTRIAQVAPLAVVVTLSLSPAFARKGDAQKPKHTGNPSVRVISLTPAQGFRSGPGTLSVSLGSTFDPDGNSNGTSSTRGGATPGSGVNPPGTVRATVQGSRNQSRRIAVELASGPTSVLNANPELNDIEVNVDPGFATRARRLHPREVIEVPELEPDGGMPGGTFEVEEADMASAARSATRTPQVLLPLILKSEQAPIAAGARSYSRTQFAVGLNGEEGLSASATFVFGRH